MKSHLSDADVLSELLARDAAKELLDASVSGLLAKNMDPRLATWLAIRLERILNGEDAVKVFSLSEPEGTPKDLHGAGRFTSDQVAALTQLSRRRFARKADADAAVAAAVGWQDSGRVLRMTREQGYDLCDRSDDDLIAMTGDELLSRFNGPGEN